MGQDGDLTLTSNNSEKAEALNHRYPTVFTVKDITNISVLPDWQGNINFEETVFSIHDVELKSRRPKIAKSPGPNEIQSRVLREAATELSKPLHHLFRQTLLEGSVQSDWKYGQITPIFGL